MSPAILAGNALKGAGVGRFRPGLLGETPVTTLRCDPATGPHVVIAPRFAGSHEMMLGLACFLPKPDTRSIGMYPKGVGSIRALHRETESESTERQVDWQHKHYRSLMIFHRERL